MLTPLEPWISAKIGLPAGTPLTRPALADYQLERLRETIQHARSRSPFYRQKLADINGADMSSLTDLATLPFTTPTDILENDLRFLCVSQSEIERVVTLQSSGTTQAAKRLYFTAQDLELTIDFFRHGMSTLVKAGERVLILMPGGLPGSVGDLLQQGLARMGAAGIVHGIVRDDAAAIAEIIDKQIDCLVGLPVQVLALARHAAATAIPTGQIKSVLLSADYVPQAIVSEIERVWGCPVFNHYGMTETGLGGAVDCRAHSGSGHLREADLYVEIIDPASGAPLPDGEAGEIVITTLTRTGMPLIRYRTGDLSRFIAAPCPCGTVLKRLAWVRGRLAAQVRLSHVGLLAMPDLDEALFPLPGLLNFQAELRMEDGRELLQVTLFTQGDDPAERLCCAARQALEQVPVIQQALASGAFRIAPLMIAETNWLSSGSIKRTIKDSMNGPHTE